MAYDKVVDSDVLESGLTSIANAIREKAGTSDALAFPAGFAETIMAIQAGGGVVLPSGFDMEYGIFIPERDTPNAEISTKRAYKWNTSDRTFGTLAIMFAVDYKSGSASPFFGFSIYNHIGKNDKSFIGINANGTYSLYAGYTVGFSDDLTSNLLRLSDRYNTTYKFKAGTSYFWLVIGEIVE